MSSSQLAELSALGLLRQLLLSTGRDAALTYAWASVSGTAWDACLEGAARLVRWEQWPELLRALLFALYPGYFAYSGAKQLNGPNGPSCTRTASRFTVLLALANLLLALRGWRTGRLTRTGASSSGST
jgi:hypothetical protein